MNKYLIFGGVGSMLAAFLHIAIIFGGPDWYRSFGAGEKMATLAGQGSLIPTISTFGIFTVLSIKETFLLKNSYGNKIIN